jgi:hypothetical protein
MFTDPAYLNGLRSSGKNWLDISDDEVIEKDLAFIINKKCFSGTA